MMIWTENHDQAPAADIVTSGAVRSRVTRGTSGLSGSGYFTLHRALDPDDGRTNHRVIARGPWTSRPSLTTSSRRVGCRRTRR